MRNLMYRFYTTVPTWQVERLLKFRETHFYKILDVAGTQWKYIACGEGEETLLILPCDLRSAEACFVQIESFEEHYRVIVPSYPPVWTIDELTDGLTAILQAEQVKEVVVMGQAYGGWLAQVFTRCYPSVVKKLVLSGTKPLIVSHKERLHLWLTVRLLPLLSEWLLMAVFRWTLVRRVVVARSERQFWLTLIDDIFVHHFGRADVLSHFHARADVLKKGYRFAKGEKSCWPGDVLLILGEYDPLISESDCQRMAEIYTHVRVEYIPDAGHTVTMSNPARFAGLVNAFVGEDRAEAKALIPA